MTLILAAQAIASEVGIPAPSSIVNNTDLSAIQLLALINRVGSEIAQRYDWAVLTKETSFTTLAAETQTSLPADYDHIVNDTMFNRSTNERIYGPYSARQWQRSNASVTGGTAYTFRIRGKSILFEPNPPAGDTIYYEYVSKYWVDTGGDGLGDAASFTSDSYTCVFDEDLLIKGGVCRLKQAKGLPYAEDFRRFEHHMELQFGRDGGKPRLNLSQGHVFTLGDGNVPETGFGS